MLWFSKYICSYQKYIYIHKSDIPLIPRLPMYGLFNHNTDELNIIGVSNRLPISSVESSKPVLANSHCIYQFKCNCGTSYIDRIDRCSADQNPWTHTTLGGTLDRSTNEKYHQESAIACFTDWRASALEWSSNWYQYSFPCFVSQFTWVNFENPWSSGNQSCQTGIVHSKEDFCDPQAVLESYLVIGFGQSFLLLFVFI